MNLARLRETLQKPNWARNGQGLLKEVEALMAGSALQPEK